MLIEVAVNNPPPAILAPLKNITPSIDNQLSVIIAHLQATYYFSIGRRNILYLKHYLPG